MTGPVPDPGDVSGAPVETPETSPAGTLYAETLAAAVRSVTLAVAALDVAMKGVDDADLPYTDLAALFDALQQARQDASRLEGDLAKTTAHTMRTAGTKTAEIDGVGVVEWTRGSTRKAWDHDALTGQVLDRHLTDAGGEIDPWAIRDALFKAAHVDYWRAGVLRDLGLDPGDYCETTPGRLGLRVTRPG